MGERWVGRERDRGREREGGSGGEGERWIGRKRDGGREGVKRER